MDQEQFDLQSSTVWSFPKRGRYSLHHSDFPGNWAPQIPRNLILRYSKEGDYVLDPFMGSGTTLIETKLLNRYGVGVDLNAGYVELVGKKLRAIDGAQQKLFVADSRYLNFVEENSINLALLHPPYANAIQYSNSPADLSLIISIDEFCKELQLVIRETSRVLRSDGIIALMIGDLRRKKRVIPLGFRVLDLCLKEGLNLLEIIIKIQHNCASTERWKSIAEKMNFLLLMHEYIFVFEKSSS
jgi:DNA modification methylase